MLNAGPDPVRVSTEQAEAEFRTRRRTPARRTPEAAQDVSAGHLKRPAVDVEQLTDQQLGALVRDGAVQMTLRFRTGSILIQRCPLSRLLAGTFLELGEDRAGGDGRRSILVQFLTRR